MSGRAHTILLDEAQECYSWGSGTFGKLGHQDLIDLLQPKHVKYFQQISKIFAHADMSAEDNSNESVVKQSLVTYAACTKHVSLFVCQGKLYSVGRNHQGMLGYVDNPETKRFIMDIKQVFNSKIKVEGVAGGANHCMAWTANGKLYSWGKLGDGCLGYMDKAPY